MSEWISVQDQLPEDGKNVLVLISDHFYPTKGRVMKIFEGAFYRDSGWDTPFWKYEDRRVIYWMHRPEDPKEE